MKVLQSRNSNTYFEYGHGVLDILSGNIGTYLQMSIEQAIDFYIALSGFTEHPGQNEFYISFGNGRFAAFEVEENVLWAEIHRDFFGEKIYTRLEGSRADFICMEGNLHDELLRYLENEEEMRVLMKKYKGEREQKERARQERLKPLPQLLTEYSS